VGTEYQLPTSGQISMNNLSQWAQVRKSQSGTATSGQQRYMNNANTRAICQYGGDTVRLGNAHGTSAVLSSATTSYSPVLISGYYYNGTGDRTDKDNRRQDPEGQSYLLIDTHSNQSTNLGHVKIAGDMTTAYNGFVSNQYNIVWQVHNGGSPANHTCSFDYYWSVPGGAPNLQANCYTLLYSNTTTGNPYHGTPLQMTDTPLTAQDQWDSKSFSFTARGDLYDVGLINFNMLYYSDFRVGSPYSWELHLRNFRFERTN